MAQNNKVRAVKTLASFYGDSSRIVHLFAVSKKTLHVKKFGLLKWLILVNKPLKERQISLELQVV